jgi:TonB-dependent SusC/RagA subfamily outer membrane receptor
MKDIIILILLFAPFAIFGQGHAINGTVTAFNKYPLENVVIKSKKNKTQVVTNEKGEFKINVAKKDILRFEAHGFEPYQLKVNKPETLKPIRTNLIYTNRPDNYEVAIGYGHIKKEDLTYAISHLLVENNDHSRYNNVYDLIQSKVAGVTLMQEGGQTIFVIRGVSSINSSNAALLVVDGIVVSSLDFLNVYDIASIQVLKDGSAAIYGSRGANGVIMINTRRGGREL